MCFIFPIPPDEMEPEAKRVKPCAPVPTEEVFLEAVKEYKWAHDQLRVLDEKGPGVHERVKAPLVSIDARLRELYVELKQLEKNPLVHPQTAARKSLQAKDGERGVRLGSMKRLWHDHPERAAAEFQELSKAQRDMKRAAEAVQTSTEDTDSYWKAREKILAVKQEIDQLKLKRKHVVFELDQMTKDRQTWLNLRNSAWKLMYWLVRQESRPDDLPKLATVKKGCLLELEIHKYSTPLARSLVEMLVHHPNTWTGSNAAKKAVKFLKGRKVYDEYLSFHPDAPERLARLQSSTQASA